MTSSLAPLLTGEGRAVLERWYSRADRHQLSPFEQSAELRRAGASPELASAVLTQCELRDRARSKFGSDALQMLLTRDGVEQATRRVVAQRRAQRFVAAGASYIADLGCGIGGDATAFLRAGAQVTAVDIDSDAAACARWNLEAAAASLANALRAAHARQTNVDNGATTSVEAGQAPGCDSHATPCPVPSWDVCEADVTALSIPALVAQGVDAIFADPARRTGQARGASRVLAPSQWSPPLPTVISWLGSVDRIGVKVAPGIDYEAIRGDFFAEWTSVDGDLVEAALWSPALAPEGPGRQATVIRAGQTHMLREPGDPSKPVAPTHVAPLGRYVAEPDGAVIRAGVVGRVAQDLGMGVVSPGIAYLTGDTVPVSPFVQGFEVVDVVGLKPSAIVGALQGLRAHSVEVKKRGADVSPEALRKAVRRALVARSGDTEEVTVIATRVEGKHRAVIARRLR